MFFRFLLFFLLFLWPIAGSAQSGKKLSGAQKDYRQSLIYKKNGKLDSAYVWLHKALQKARKKNDSVLLSKIFYNLGAIDLKYGYKKLGEFHAVKSMEYIPSTLPDGIHKGLPYNLLGNIFKEQNRYKKAEEYYQKFRRQYRQEKQYDTVRYYLSYLNNMGIIQGYQHHLSQAIQYMDSILETPSVQTKYPDAYARALINKGQFLVDENKISQAYPLILEGVKIYKNSHDPLNLLWAYLVLADLMEKMHLNKQAIFYVRQAMKIAQEKGIPEKEKSALKILIRLDDPEKIPLYFQRYRELEKLIEQRENRTKDLSLLTIYEVAEKERELAQKDLQLMRFRRHISNLLILLVALLGIALVVLYYLRKIKRHKDIIAAQEQMLFDLYVDMHHRMENNYKFFIKILVDIQNSIHDPHINMYEALQSVVNKMKSFIEIHKELRYEVKKKKDYKSFKLHALTQKIFDNMKKDGIRLENQVDTHLDLKADKVFLTGLIIHEFITNSFKHAFDEHTQDGLISIRFYKENGDYILMLSDNGKGQRMPDSSPINEKSVGLELIKSIHRQLDPHSRHNQNSNRFRIDRENGFSIFIKFKA